ncbi:hypothetical protein DPMN_036052 [Dreissena polymorpha]|uniref:Uncharacterized protein n=1 Tax=Dreissena polymorpha TaxID=45954 RepID=A0A9D4MBV5_DREPO|nr:hypothetical protein DPMN_036052 [Dreissena polymorpha]
MNCVTIFLPSLMPRTYFVKQTSLRSFSQSETKLSSCFQRGGDELYSWIRL